MHVDHDDYSTPSLWTNQHEFVNKYIKKATAEAQIDEAVSEGYDMYFNFMWGQLEDPVVAGIDAVKHLESKGVPFVGMPSRILERTKLDFYRDAAAAGLPVPGTTKLPLFVKPAKSCASRHITEKSLCRTQEEVDALVKELNEILEPGRKVADPNYDGSKDPLSYGDIVVQEFIEGRDYSCIIIEMNDTPVALNPATYNYPASTTSKERFLSWDIKWHDEVKLIPLEKADDPALFVKLQKLAVEAWKANKMTGGAWGNVDFRVRYDDGEPVLMEVNPMPALYLSDTTESIWEDNVITGYFPGAHRALTNILISTKLWQMNDAQQSRVEKIKSTYDWFSTGYDKVAEENFIKIISCIVEKFDFDGSILDVCSGTGLFGRLLVEAKKIKESEECSDSSGSSSPLTPKRSVLFGVELSEAMTQASSNSTMLYDYIHMGPMQAVLPKLDRQFDHIISLSSLHFLDTSTLSLVLNRMFELAEKSVTITIDDIPDVYNEHLVKSGYEHMYSFNHTKEVEEFGVPKGWKVVHQEYQYAWTSPTTGDGVYTTLWRFERV